MNRKEKNTSSYIQNNSTPCTRIWQHHMVSHNIWHKPSEITDNTEHCSQKPYHSKNILHYMHHYSMLLTYLHKINPTLHPSPLCPLCKINNHDTKHLFSCPSINATLTSLDLWNDPVSTAELLSLWEDALAAAGGGAGPQLVDGAGRG